MKQYFSYILSVLAVMVAFPAAAFTPDTDYLRDRAALEHVQRDTFKYMWNDAHPVSGMAHEATFGWDVRPVAVGGTGFGVAAIVVGVDRGWITREEAVARLLKITHFLRDAPPRKMLHGAFPHWMNGETGEIMPFSNRDAGADIVETSLLVQGLLIARSYFDGPGSEATLRAVITEIWEAVDWNWFTNKEENGLYWHWDEKSGFSTSLKILGYNECLITYVLAAASPTHPISPKAYTYWTSGKWYQPKTMYGYTVEAAEPGGGSLFLTHYSFVGLDPRRLADAFVPNGYFVRNVKQTLSNRNYCIYEAPTRYKYSSEFWGLSASQIKGGYTASSPTNDTGTIAPTAAIASIPYAPHQGLQVLHTLRGRLREKVWGPYGPYDGMSLKDDWVSDLYLAIDQLPMVSMVENYRSGLLWNAFMTDADVRNGLAKVGMHEPVFKTGFPEAVITRRKEGKKYVDDAYDARRHPDGGLYKIPFWSETETGMEFTFTSTEGHIVHSMNMQAGAGRNVLQFPQFMRQESEIVTVTMKNTEGTWSLPVRLR